MIVGDGVRPSNTGRGYVLRRLLRRALTVLWRPDRTRTLGDLPSALVEHTLEQFGQDTDPELVRGILRDEERRFAVLMTRGRKVLERFGPAWQPTPEDLTYLHQTHGLPPDLVTELLAEPGETSTSVLGPEADRGTPAGPGGGLLELAGDPDEQVLPPVGRDELHADGQAAGRPVQRQGDGRLPGHVELRGVGDEADDAFPLVVRPGRGEPAQLGRGSARRWASPAGRGPPTSCAIPRAHVPNQARLSR